MTAVFFVGGLQFEGLFLGTVGIAPGAGPRFGGGEELLAVSAAHRRDELNIKVAGLIDSGQAGMQRGIVHAHHIGEGLVKEGVISGGMIPKIGCCIEAIRRGVKKVFVLDGTTPHAILIEILTNEGIGTMFR